MLEMVSQIICTFADEIKSNQNRHRMRRILLLWACMSCMIAGMAKDFHGTVYDSKGQSISYANIVVLTAKDSAFVTGTVTNEKGQYSMNVEEGNVILKVSCVGYKDLYSKPGNDTQDFTLQEDAIALNTVVVKGNLPKYKTSLEGMVTTVAGSSLSGLGSGSDVLRHIPGVFASDGGYVVFGKGTPLIYINNRKIFNISEIENLKSEDIKSVEVLTSPGAKYDAQVKAVIKITTKKAVGEGFSMNWLTRYDQSYLTNPSTRLNWTYRHKELDIFGSHYYGYNNSWTKSELTQSINSDEQWFQSFYQDARSRYANLNNTIGLNYQLDKNNSLGIRYLNSWRMTDKDWNSLQSTVSENGKAYDKLISDTYGKEKHDPTHQVNLYYAGQLGKASVNWDVDYYHKQSDAFSFSNEASENYESREVNASGKSLSELFATKLSVDFNALAGQITLGTEYSTTRRKDSYLNPENYVDSSDSRIKEQHASPFGQIAWNLPFGQLQAGIRYEYVWYDYEDKGEKVAEQSKHFSNLFPNVTFATGFGNTQLLLSYSVKTKRPSYSQLSSNVFYGNRFTYQGGNPYLIPVTEHNVSLAASYKFLQAKVDYTDDRDAILYWGEMYKESNTTSLITYKNIKSLKTMTCFLVASPQLGFWEPTLQTGVIKQWLTMPTADGNISFNKPIFVLSLSNLFQFGRGWQGYIDLGYTSKGNNENVHITRSQFSNSLYVAKSILQNHLSFYLGASDIFGPQKSGNDIQFYQMKTTQTKWSSSRNVYVAVRYRINSVKSKYKGNGAGEIEKNRL